MPDSSPSKNAFTAALTVPNLLTIGRMVAIPFFVHAALQRRFLLAFGLFVAAFITDAFDGYLARRLNQRSKLGAFLDPAADKTMMFSGYVVFTMHGIATHRLPGWLTFTFFARDILIVFMAYLLYTRINIRGFPPSVAGKVATISQVVALSTTIAANTILSVVALVVLPFVIAFTLLATLYSGFDYLRKAERMFEERVAEAALARETRS